MNHWRGVKSLVHDAVDATTHLVGEGHASAARSVRRVGDQLGPLGAPVRVIDDVRHGLTTGILAAIRGVNRVVAIGSDAGLDALVALAGPQATPPCPIPMRSDLLDDPRLLADAALGLLNGAVGHHLAAQGSPLDMGLVLRHGDRYLTDDAPAPERATRRLVVLVHGLSTTEWSWCLDAHRTWGDPTVQFGALLERDLGFTPVFVRYNSGRRVVDNGAQLAIALERLVAAWPGPLDELVLLGHSMGGLVSRSATRAARAHDHRWLRKLSRVIALGSPHQGAPLARFGERTTALLGAIDLPATRIVSRVLDQRSVGIKDLEHGAVSEDGACEALVDGVSYHFLAGTLSKDPQDAVGAWVGDLLVRPASAHGPATPDAAFRVHRSQLGGVLHHQLQNHRAVYAQVRQAVGDAAAGMPRNGAG